MTPWQLFMQYPALLVIVGQLLVMIFLLFRTITLYDRLQTVRGVVDVMLPKVDQATRAAVLNKIGDSK